MGNPYVLGESQGRASEPDLGSASGVLCFQAPRRATKLLRLLGGMRAICVHVLEGGVVRARKLQSTISIAEGVICYRKGGIGRASCGYQPCKRSPKQRWEIADIAETLQLGALAYVCAILMR